MNTDKAAYWIALGVLALGLNSEYRQGDFVTLHRVADRAESLLCRISTRAGETLALARLVVARPEYAPANLLAATSRAETARLQAEMLREQTQDEAELIRDRIREHVRDEIRARADVVRDEGEMQRAKIEQLRWSARSKIRLARTDDRRVMVVCPKTGARIAVNAGPAPEDVIADVEVDDSF